MRILIVPDVHGNTGWKEPVMKALTEEDTHIVFLGDYVDSYYWRPFEIIDNLKEIIEVKRNNATKVTLLLGNHDYAYVFAKFDMRGFDYHGWIDYRQIINSNWNLFDIAWGFQGKERYTLFSHAGLTQSFYKQLEDEIEDENSIMNDILVKEADTYWKKLPLHEMINYFADQCHILWQIGISRNGNFDSGSILWADKTDLIDDRYVGIDQVVGHSCMVEALEVNFNTDRLIFTDIHTDRTIKCFYLTLE